MVSFNTKSIQIIGHRGSAAPFQGNTLEAILYGILSGAKMIEIDLRLSKDKEVILSHDENLSKIAGINKNISDKTWEELSLLQIKKKKEIFRLARLKDVFKSVPGDIQFYLEIKTSIFLHSSGWDKKLADKVISLIKKEKIKKDKFLDLSLEKNTDILGHISKHNSLRPKLVVGFAAETNSLKNNSLKKLSEKNCDWIIANDISKNDIGFESDFNKVSIFYKNNSEENLPKMRKSSLANEIVNRIISQLN